MKQDLNNIDFIIQNKEFAITQKLEQLNKSDFSNILLNTAQKAFDNSISKIEVLVYETLIRKDRNEFMFNQYKNGYVYNHSVGMRYVKLYLCYNNSDPIYSQEKDNWDKYYPLVLNKDIADNQDYFWAITKAKNIEASAVVKGSNFLTPVLSVETIGDNTIRVKLAVSPCNVIDSHSDCHIKGLWNDYLNENIYDLLLQEHDMCFENVISDSVKDELKVYTKMISVKELISKFNQQSADGKISNPLEPEKEEEEKNLQYLLKKFK